jgi:hypothetical protein
MVRREPVLALQTNRTTELRVCSSDRATKTPFQLPLKTQTCLKLAKAIYRTILLPHTAADFVETIFEEVHAERK